MRFIRINNRTSYYAYEFTYENKFFPITISSLSRVISNTIFVCILN